MQAQKKKPRQRNRPKNKANRLEEQKSKNQIQQKNYSNQNRVVQVQNNNLGCTAQNQLATQTLYDSHEVILLIQQQMREKFLKKQQQQFKIKGENDKALTFQKDTDVQIKPEIMTIASTTNNTTNVNSPKLNGFFEEIESSSKSLTNTGKLKINKNQETQNGQSDKKNVFITNLQKQMEQVMASGNSDLPQTILGNLQKLLDQEPVDDIVSSDEDEYIEYIYKPRQYFLATLCNFCNIDLCKEGTTKYLLPCKRCQLTYYCSTEHMRSDEKHRQLCYALRQIADSSGGHVFYKCGDFSSEQFRSYRVVTMRKAEALINRPLTPTEQEIILFPRVCIDSQCREYRFNKLVDCGKCGQVAHCRFNAAHFPKTHYRWCQFYRLLKELIFKMRFERLDPPLPAKILKDLPALCCDTRQILEKLNCDVRDPCDYAALTQISTGPLTAWYALKLCASLKNSSATLTIHLIGAELEFEVNALHKWELFFLHLAPAIKELNIVFIGPELNPRNICFKQLQKTRCCRSCRKAERTVNYFFESHLYHVYCKSVQNSTQPDLICFFNAGLYRTTGYHLQDTWPQTILAAAQFKCPVVVTSYTEYEAPLDMIRFVQECNRHLNVVLPPTMNPFASEKPERNFVSDDEAPLIFKNYYCFIIE